MASRVIEHWGTLREDLLTVGKSEPACGRPAEVTHHVGEQRRGAEVAIQVDRPEPRVEHRAVCVRHGCQAHPEARSATYPGRLESSSVRAANSAASVGRGSLTGTPRGG
ncbi:MAG: hypothetical protein M5U19_15495 [Microthrixaceae bacterium]|nr:hypothetical protein [Microthrixaceae bacterium]